MKNDRGFTFLAVMFSVVLIGIFVSADASIAVAVAIRNGWPARHPSPKNSSASRMAIIASLPSSDVTDSFTLPPRR